VGWTAALVLALAAGAARGEPRAPDWRWQRSPSATRGAPLTALALAPAGDRLALGSDEGVSVGRIEIPGVEVDSGALPVTDLRRWPAVGSVRDLAFAQDESLWIGTETGLWHLAPDARLEQRTPGAGETARRILRVQSAAGWVGLATEAGAYLSRDGRRWRRLIDGLPSGAVTTVALRSANAAAAEVWLLCAGRLWHAWARVEDGDLSVEPAREAPIPGRPARDLPVDIGVDLPGAEIAVLYPRAVALRQAASASGRWEVWYPVLPPGAAARRLARAAGSLWLVTDRGLLAADELGGPWRRATGVAGATPVAAVVGAGALLLAAGDSGLLYARPGSGVADRPAPAGGDPPTARPQPSLPVDPALGRVRERALVYLGLEAERSAALRARAGRRGWLPVMSLRAAAAYDRDTQDDLDESFSYGELHALRNRESGRSRDFEASVSFSWDLADLVFDPRLIDFSREERLVIALRDDLLDEVTQLYFDRRRVLLALAAFADRSDPEAVALALRAEELAAGLDAWTGGWFSRQVRLPGDASP